VKVQERTGSSNQGPPAPARSLGERLPAPPRERKPALAALAVLLILVGALGATVLVLRAGDRIEVLKVTAKEIPAGQSLKESDVTSVMVADDPSIGYVTPDQIGQLAKTRTKGALFQGTLLIGNMLTYEKGTPAGKAVVGLFLKDGQYPAELQAGDTVAAYRVGDKGTSGNAGASPSGSPDDPVIVDRAVVSKVERTDASTLSSGNLPVTLTVDAADAAALTQASSAGDVALVIVPAGNS
jgi:hypothetical protein